MNKKILEEINVISNSPNRRPYASGISLVLEEGLEYGFDGEACLLLDADFIVRIKPVEDKIKYNGKKLQQLTAFIEGFTTAGKAEEMGLKLTLALLWAAVSEKWHLKLDYHTPQPCMVFDRSQKKSGVWGEISGSISFRSSANTVSELINEILSKQIDFDPRLLISMELFTSARLESTERAKFIGLVSSLEPLAIQKKCDNQEIDNLISSFVSQVKSVESLSVSFKNSIIGRALSLNRESVSQAIASFVQGYFPEKPEIVNIVKEAYNIRSSMLHNGTFDADLDEKGKKLEDIIRYIYSQILKLDLIVPVNMESLV